MKKNKSSRMTSTAVAMLGVAVFASTLEAGSPPSRQTPYIVPKDKQGLVEVGPCQMPPCVGGKTCVPNARDYGYYEGTWRKWQTQQRYDQSFPQAVGATPMNRSQSQSLGTSTGSIVQSPQSSAPILTVPEEDAPAPAMGNFEAPNIVVPSVPAVATPEVVREELSVPVQEAPRVQRAPVDPLLDYSSNQVPGISTAPTITAAAPVQDNPPTLEALPEPQEVPQADTLPVPEDDADTELTAPTADSAPLLETEPEGDDSSLSVPMSQAPTGERSIIIHQEKVVESVPADNGNFAATRAFNPYDHAIQVSHTEDAANPFSSVEANSFDTSSSAMDAPGGATVNDVLEGASASNPFERTSISESGFSKASPSEAAVADGQIGLDGFCPVALIEKEEWVEGSQQWSVMHEGITYYLSSAEQVQKFLADPVAYTPVMNGVDPVLLAESGESAFGNADNCVVFEGKLFMFTTEENLNKFFENTTAYVK